MASKNLLEKCIDSRCFNLHPSSSISFPTRLVPRKERTLGTTLSRSICQKLTNFSEVKVWRSVCKLRKDNENRYLELALYTKPEIRKFYVTVVQQRQRNVQKSVMHPWCTCKVVVLLIQTYCFFAVLVAVPSNDSRNNCGTHFVSSFLLFVSKVANGQWNVSINHRRTK